MWERRTGGVGCSVKRGGQARLTEKGTSGKDLRDVRGGAMCLSGGEKVPGRENS